MPTDIDKTTSFTYRDTDETRLAKAFKPLLEDKSPDAGILPLANGIDAFTARYMLIKAAERSIDVQYYIWHNDTTGKLLVHALIVAADRGVRVRVLLDDINMAGKDEALIAMARHPNIEVRLFNPFVNRKLRFIDIVGNFSRINRRMHNKSLTADNQATIVGGRNVGDEYFNANPNIDFHDFDVFAIGNVVHEVSNQFDIYWNSDYAIPIDVLEKIDDASAAQTLMIRLNKFIDETRESQYAEAIRQSDFIDDVKQKKLKFYWGKMVVLYDDPDKIKLDHDDTSTHLSSKIQPLLEDTQKEIIVISPYFIPGKVGMERFKELRERGASIKVLTNSLASTDVPIVYSGYAPYRVPLLKNNVELFEIKSSYKPRRKKKILSSSSRSSLHSKIYIFDRKKTFVGSYNLDPRSAKINTEMGILIYNAELAGLIGQWWDENINKVAYKLGLERRDGEYGEEDKVVWHDFSVNPNKRYDVPPKAGFWKQLGSDVLSILPIEDQL